MADEQKPSPETAADTAETQQDAAQADEQGQAQQAEDVTSASEQDEAAQLKVQLEALQAEFDAQKDGVLRAQAETQNVQRRAERDVENAHKFALEKMVNELLPIVDNLERALTASEDQAAESGVAAIREGVEMTLSMFQQALTKFNIEAVDPQGEPFDPQLHQAMSMVENDQVEPNTVLTVMQKGYTLHGRLVRPAMVMVAKASAASASGKIDEQA